MSGITPSQATLPSPSPSSLELEGPPLPPYATIEVESEGRWFKDPWGKTVFLGRTRIMRRLLATLVRRRMEAPGQPISTTELFHQAWPDHHIPHHSAQGRVFMALSRLRTLGMAGILVHAGGGYLIPENVDVTVKVAS
jgi:hypothetical protein